MKTFVIACAAVLFSAATATATDVAVTESTLQTMGLSGMQQMSDEEGMTVRGQGLIDNWFNGATSHIAKVTVDFGQSLGGLGDHFNLNFGNNLGFNFDFGNFNF